MNSLLRVTALITAACAFVPSHSSDRPASSLPDIHEWRDIDYSDQLPEDCSNMSKLLNIFPFAITDILVQGETKQLRLYEERFHSLFQDALDNHAGMVAMGLITFENELVATVPLCHLEAYVTIEGSIFATLRVVGRAKLLGIQQEAPFIRAVTSEIFDELDASVGNEVPDKLCAQIEEVLKDMTELERKISESTEEPRKISSLELDDRFFNDDLDEDDDDEGVPSRWRRYEKAKRTAQENDTQGYTIGDSTETDKSPQEWTAISWAAFGTDLDPDPTRRIQALDSTSVVERLSIAFNLLEKQKETLRRKIGE